MQIKLVLVLLATFATLITLPTASAKVIQAEIEHRETLPEVPEVFRRGSILKADKLNVRIEWFPVPNWMAGTWTKDGDIETFEEDFRTGRQSRKSFWLKNRVTLSFGHMIDAMNTIWHAEVVPFRADGKRKGVSDQRYVIAMKCLRSTPEAVVLRFHSVVVSLGRRGKVEGSRQQEEIVSFYPQNDRFIATRSSTKTFTSKGKPLYRLDSHTKRLKTGDFRESDFLRGVDLKSSFANFLVSNNMQDRVPK